MSESKLRDLSMLNKSIQYTPGDVFYYRAQKKRYGGVFLFYQEPFYLIALSEEITVPVQCIRVEDVLRSPLYTLAWFSDTELLAPRRIHRIGKVNVIGDFSNRAGLLIDGQGSVRLKNVGQSATWKHAFSSFTLRDTVIGDVLSTRSVPKTRSESFA